jgi:hypothetical protein
MTLSASLIAAFYQYQSASSKTSQLFPVKSVMEKMR